MKQRTIRIIKIVLGAYLTFVGSVHFINIYDQKPSNMYLHVMIAFFFIITGVLYMIWDVRKLVERILREKAELAAQKEAEEREKRYNELHSSDKFRTAPMHVVRPISLEKEEEDLEDFEEDQIIITVHDEKENSVVENIHNEKSEESEESTIDIEEPEKSEEKQEEEE